MTGLAPGAVGEAEGGDPHALPAAFDGFFRANRGYMLRLATYRLGCSHDAQEVVQDAFLIAFRNWERLLSAQNPTALLYRILQDCVIDQHRRRVRLARREQLTEVDPEVEDLKAVAFEELFSIREAIDRLPPRQREVITLKYLIGLDNHEIAAVLDLSAPTVSLHVKRARQRLRALLGP
ncbi:RNA polymerase sigma factor [Streptomyces sioyaensis]|uniref:RNA polymerase sigma factor n=1 Tax=Streptomyces sioyaensis TaxID=67364 RepID=UPI003792CC2D